MRHQARLPKAAIPHDLMALRLVYADHVLGVGHAAVWCHDNAICVGICNGILPLHAKKAAKQAAKKAKKKAKKAKKKGKKNKSES